MLWPLGPAPDCFPHQPSLTQGAQASGLPSPTLSHLIFPNERQRMAGSWGTKVEAAFNQSPLLAGCPEELAEERMGAAAGEEVQRGL